MRTTRSGASNGRRRRKRSCIKLKIAVFVPIPSASVSTARRVNPGDLRSWRRANFRSFISFGANGDNWIDPRGTARRQQTPDESHCSPDQRDDEHRAHVGGADPEQETLKQMRRNKNTDKSERQ